MGLVWLWTSCVLMCMVWPCFAEGLALKTFGTGAFWFLVGAWFLVLRWRPLRGSHFREFSSASKVLALCLLPLG